MGQYSTGTVAATTGSATIAGTGTAWSSRVVAGDWFAVGGVTYTVAAIASDTQLSLTAPYAGVTCSGMAYAIQSDFTPLRGLPIPARGDTEIAAILARMVQVLDTAFATAAQGAKADSALQAASIGVTIQPYSLTLTGWSAKALPTGTVVGADDVQTLNNKTLAAPALSGTVTGTYTLGGTPTITTPTLTSPTVSSAGLAVLAITGGASTSQGARINLSAGSVHHAFGTSEGIIGNASQDLAAYVDGGYNYLVYTGGALRLRTSAASTGPGIDNTFTLGDGSFRWSTVYAGTGTINTSDGRTKRLRGSTALTDGQVPLPESVAAARLVHPEIDAFAACEVAAYQMLDSIAEKGADGARIHVGVITQQVEAAFASRGLDVRRYAFWCEDELTEMVDEVVEVERQATISAEVARTVVEVIDGRAVQRTVTEIEEVPAWEECPLFDADGEPIMDGENQAVHRVPVLVKTMAARRIERPALNPDGTRKTRQGIRADQLLFGMVAALRHRFDEAGTA